MILEKSQEILKKHALCDNCLGRQFAQLGSGTTNQDRGESIKETLMMKADILIKEEKNPSEMKDLAKSFKKANKALERRGYDRIQIKKCHLCKNLFKNLTYFANRAIEEIDDLKFDTFLFGTKLDSSLTKREEKFWAKFGAKYSESIKSEINREIGKIIEKKTDKIVNLENPEVDFLLNTEKQEIEININPLYIYGRYRKLSREIPQCEWHCPVCRGDGCMRCDGTGYLYENSVEKIISEPLLEKTKGQKTVFHGSGREDVDVKMLGKGRPFVIEVKNPKNRKINLEELKTLINDSQNDVEVNNLEFTEKEKVRDIKQAKPPKVYRSVIKTHKTEKEILKALEEFKNSEIIQKTPKRISRRPEKVRKRNVLDTNLVDIEDNKATIEFKTEAGLYIKELISGDGERTKPSLSSLLEENLECQKLDVMEIEY
ncbi:tRNA pseudouridine(54/55) synthase Pus10 [archaeon SCG-AAA382B04]|nr:tRNA pseudouridine(54/55) synthase Pus10 [archaeon SCG-AAA382B04]